MNIQGFKKSYGGRIVLDMPDFTLENGKIYAVIGANGSGKSTLAKILAGIIKADDGQKTVPPGIKTGYMPQKSYGFHMKTLANLLLVSPDKAKADRLMNAFGINKLRTIKASRISGGEMQKLSLSRLMMKTFDLMILDEPTASMDIESSLNAEKIIKDYCRECGCTTIIITHSIPQAERISDNLMFLSDGKLIETGETEKMLQNPKEKLTEEFLKFSGK